MTGYAAILRGINVGGKKRLPMKGLVELFVAAGCIDGKDLYPERQCHLQSEECHRPSTFRSHLERHPARLRASSTRGDTHGSMWCSWQRCPVPLTLPNSIRNARHPKFAIRGREIYLSCPNGVARTKLTNAYFDSKLGTIRSASRPIPYVWLTARASVRSKRCNRSGCTRTQMVFSRVYVMAPGAPALRTNFTGTELTSPCGSPLRSE